MRDVFMTSGGCRLKWNNATPILKSPFCFGDQLCRWIRSWLCNELCRPLEISSRIDRHVGWHDLWSDYQCRPAEQGGGQLWVILLCDLHPLRMYHLYIRRNNCEDSNWYARNALILDIQVNTSTSVYDLDLQIELCPFSFSILWAFFSSEPRQWAFNIFCNTSLEWRCT